MSCLRLGARQGLGAAASHGGRSPPLGRLGCIFWEAPAEFLISHLTSDEKNKNAVWHATRERFPVTF